jgi:hypothetical protein
MLFCHVLKKVCPVFHWVTTKAFVINRYCNNHVGEQEIKTKHDKDKRFHDDRSDENSKETSWGSGCQLA